MVIKSHKEHASYQLLVQTPTPTAQNGKVMSVNNVPQEAILIKMEYVSQLILIARIQVKDYAFLVMMDIHYK